MFCASVGLKELLLQRESQGNFRALRTKRSTFDVNPLDRKSQVMRKKAKIHETDLQLTDPALQTLNADPKNKLVIEEEDFLTKLERQVETVFGVTAQRRIPPNPHVGNPPRSQERTPDELPVLSTLQVQFLNEPYRGFIPTAADLGASGPSTSFSISSFSRVVA